ncbi:MFS transporter [Corynebacterium felinum]|uniref:MFS family permease n=1 Tax=Corynebacterium felinum TaxID=131318 RepID=A0ABU2BA61_9CORY|nr:MFS transporter [Corynebacterium felinum]MDF5821617.1 MFS transporter [Corynebacterium felinum]MDR7354628.1 MFS family permease [Corynebacterium felinum]WJY93993.1 Major Facilitator Superfamily protein [Corynebacterium felinum]
MRAFLFSNSLDALAGSIAAFTLSLYLVSASAISPVELAILNAAPVSVVVLLSTACAQFVDRVGARRLLPGVLVVKTALLLCLVLLVAAGLMGPWAAIVISTVLALAGIGSDQCQLSLSRDFPDNQLSTLVSRLSAADKMASIVAPSMVGFLVLHARTEFAFGLAFALSAASVFAFYHFRRTSPVSATCEDSTPEPSFWAGFQVIRRDRVLAATIGLACAGNFGLALGDVVMPFLLLQDLGLHAHHYGMLASAGGAAALAAAFVAPRIIDHWDTRRIVVVTSVVAFLLSTLPVCAWFFGYLAPAIVMDIGWAMVMTVQNIAVSTFISTRVAKDVIARVFAAYGTIGMGLVPVFVLLGGGLAQASSIGVPLALWPVLTAISLLIFLPPLVRTADGGGGVDTHKKAPTVADGEG